MTDDLRAGIEALRRPIPDSLSLAYDEVIGWNAAIDALLDALLAAHPVQDECLDCGRTDGGCDRVVVPASVNVEPLCERPPKGWICARLRGHRGPCLSLMETL